MSGLNIQTIKHAVDRKRTIRLALAFMLFTVIGTLSHEAGHIIVAKALGYETTLHFGSMNYYPLELTQRQEEIFLANKNAMINGEDFPEKEEYKRIIDQLVTPDPWVSLGGPIQTCLTGIIGLLLLYLRRKKIQLQGFTFTDWLAVFLALFWIRQVFNLIITVAQEFLYPDGNFFGGDELAAAEALNLPHATFALPLAVIGLAASLFIVFKVIPKKVRLTFVLAGLIGSGLGLVLWMVLLGPLVLP